MNKENRIIVRMRQSQALRCVALIVLWIATTASIPMVQVNPGPLSQQEHKILPPDPIPNASPGCQSKSIQEFSACSVTAPSLRIPEEHHYTLFPSNRNTPGLTRKLSDALVYTQTTSSFL